MDWQGGLFRTWIVVSLCWISLMGFGAYQNVISRQWQADAAEIANAKAAGDRLADCRTMQALYAKTKNLNCPMFSGVVRPSTARRYTGLLSYILSGVGAPIGLLAAYFASIWVGAGFKPSNE
jgi:hypothetical protein